MGISVKSLEREYPHVYVTDAGVAAWDGGMRYVAGFELSGDGRGARVLGRDAWCADMKALRREVRGWRRSLRFPPECYDITCDGGERARRMMKSHMEDLGFAECDAAWLGDCDVTTYRMDLGIGPSSFVKAALRIPHSGGGYAVSVSVGGCSWLQCDVEETDALVPEMDNLLLPMLANPAAKLSKAIAAIRKGMKASASAGGA